MSVRPVIEAVGSLEALRPGWDALAEAAGHPFATWEWADAWWAARPGGGGALHLHRVLDAGGRLAAVLPLYVTRRGPVALLRPVGHGAADELGPVCAPADAALAGRALAQVAAALPRPGLLLADRLPGDSPATTALGGRVLRRESSPLLATEGRTWDEWLATRKSSFRSQVRRRERKLVRERGLVFRRTTDAATLDADLDLLFALHDARWAAGESASFTAPRRRLHRDFARRALERGWLRLWFAELDGRPAAAWYGLRFGGSDWYYQAGRDPAHEDTAVGTVLLLHTIRDTFDAGLTSYRFGLGDEPYKFRFASADPGLVTVVAGHSVLPRVAGLGAEAARRLPPELRQRLLAPLR